MNIEEIKNLRKLVDATMEGDQPQESRSRRQADFYNAFGPHQVRTVLALTEKQLDTFQQRVQPWMMACFGEKIAGDREERNHRFLEESLELVQACGCTANEAHQLVDYVYGRPVGERAQEVGGVMVALAALCLAQGLDMHAAGETELARIWTKVEAIRAKQAAKPKHSPLPVAAAQLVADEKAALADQDQVPYLIYFDDADRKPEMVIGGTRAQYRFKQISGAWNANLFAKIASNSKDDKYPCATLAATLAQAQQPGAIVYPPDGTLSPFTVINLGHGLVKIGDSLHDGRLPALWFGKEGLGMGVAEEMNRAAKDGETLAVVTFSNLEGLDVLAEVVQRIRSIAFPAAPVQPVAVPDGAILKRLVRYDAVSAQNNGYDWGVEMISADAGRFVEFDDVSALLAAPAARHSAISPSVATTGSAATCAEMRALCSACGGTGDVHSIDGEWRGQCTCVHAWQQRAEKAEADLKQANEWRAAALAENVQSGERWAKRVAELEAQLTRRRAPPSPETQQAIAAARAAGQSIAATPAGLVLVFISDGTEPNVTELDCPACGGSGHAGDVKAGSEP